MESSEGRAAGAQQMAAGGDLGAEHLLLSILSIPPSLPDAHLLH